MIMDLAKYELHKPWIKSMMDRERQNPSFEREKHMGIYSATTHVPIIAVMHMYGSLYGYDEELQKDILLVAKFYRYSEITGADYGE